MTSGVEPLPVANRKMLAVLPSRIAAHRRRVLHRRAQRGDRHQAGSIRSLGVIAWQSTRQYKQTSESPQEIGRELGAQYLLEGTVRWEKSSQGQATCGSVPP